MREGRRRKRKEGGEKNTSSYAGEVGEESGEKQHVGGLLKEGQRRSEGSGGGKKRGQEMEPTSRLGDLASQNVPKYVRQKLWMMR